MDSNREMDSVNRVQQLSEERFPIGGPILLEWFTGSCCSDDSFDDSRDDSRSRGGMKPSPLGVIEDLRN
ncbi:hypothetical protein ABZ153_41390 [Streptomyces sp. NPDC006290]|uniref:hypothetical protein n=1 Tax=Streptomyces sp. NPDC006290 TaxID=3156745 RepID=UPI0033BB42C1